MLKALQLCQVAGRSFYLIRVKHNAVFQKSLKGVKRCLLELKEYNIICINNLLSYIREDES
jgi:hypothetical protein